MRVWGTALLPPQVVGMLSLLAALCHIPSAVMGLSLLAVGNALGDFFSNLSLTRRGASTTALTACFASPLFNMLLSFGIGFPAYFARNGVDNIKVARPRGWKNHLNCSACCLLCPTCFLYGFRFYLRFLTISGTCFRLLI